MEVSPILKSSIVKIAQTITLPLSVQCKVRRILQYLKSYLEISSRLGQIIKFSGRWRNNAILCLSDEPSQSWLLCYLSQIIKHGNEALAGLVATLSQEPSPTNDLQVGLT